VLADRVALLKRAEAAQDAAAKATGTAVAVQKKRLAALDATQQAVNADALAQSAMVSAAHQRAADLKDLLEEYVRGRMLFHCRALEGFSRASAVIAAADPSLAAAEVQRRMLDAATDSSVLVVPGAEDKAARGRGAGAGAAGASAAGASGVGRGDDAGRGARAARAAAPPVPAAAAAAAAGGDGPVSRSESLLSEDGGVEE